MDDFAKAKSQDIILLSKCKIFINIIIYYCYF